MSSAPNVAAQKHRAGAEAVAAKGWLAAHKWLLARRCSQLGILALFLLGPLAGVWIVKGNLSYSLTLNTLPLTDPYVFLQSLVVNPMAKPDAPFATSSRTCRAAASSIAGCPGFSSRISRPGCPGTRTVSQRINPRS